MYLENLIRGVITAAIGRHGYQYDLSDAGSQGKLTKGRPAGISDSATVTAGWILYDGSCGFCARWVPFWRLTLERRGFGIAPLQTPWVAERLELPPDELVQDLRLLLADGMCIAGADAYRYVMRRIWWAWPVYLLASMPLLGKVFDWCYRKFALHRHTISKSCGLPDPNFRK